MKLLYIAGPYRGDSASKIDDNIHRAREVAKLVWEQGDCAICPHLNTAHMDGLVPDKQFLNGDLEILRRCDGIVMMENWNRSEGAKRELRVARRRKIPVYWQRHTYIYTSEEKWW